MPYIAVIIGVFIALLMFMYYSYHVLLFLPKSKYRKIWAGIITFVIIATSFVVRILLGFIINVTIIMLALDGITLLVSRFEKPKAYWNTLYQKGILALVIAVFVSVYGFYNASHVIVTEYEVLVQKDIADTNVMVVSDMHISTAIGQTELDTFKKNVETLQPDIILLVGDIYDESSTQEDMEYSYTIFSQIAKTYPMYFVSGNHEVGHGYGGILETKAIAENLEKAGVQVVKDEVVEWQDIYIIGRQDASISNRAELTSLTDGLDSNNIWIVMDHQPSEYQKNKDLGVDVQVSGHTHGGQIFPVGQLDSLLQINEKNYGYEQDGQFHMIVSSGMGTWGFKMRTSYRCEIVMVKIRGE